METAKGAAEHQTTSSSAVGTTSTSEEVFQRILRRLQRAENFATLEGHQATTGATSAADLLEGTGRGPQKERNGGGGGTTTSPSGQALSMLHKQQQQQLVAAGGGEAGSKQSTRQEDEQLQEEARYGEDPIPATLRVLIDSVRHTLTQKLELAAVGSVKDALRLLFEGRTLLDKLLKDIPFHGNLVDVDGKAQAGTVVVPAPPGKRPMVNHVQLKDIFHGFKQRPVVLPTSRYTVDEETGKVLPQLLMPKGHNQQIASHRRGSGPSAAFGAFGNASMSQNPSAVWNPANRDAMGGSMEFVAVDATGGRPISRQELSEAVFSAGGGEPSAVFSDVVPPAAVVPALDDGVRSKGEGDAAASSSRRRQSSVVVTTSAPGDDAPRMGRTQSRRRSVALSASSSSAAPPRAPLSPTAPGSDPSAVLRNRRSRTSVVSLSAFDGAGSTGTRNVGFTVPLSPPTSHVGEPSAATARSMQRRRSSVVPLPHVGAGLGVGSPPSTASGRRGGGGGGGVSPSSPVFPSGLTWKDQQLLLKHLRRETQRVTQGSQTEESIAKLVPEREHQAVVAKVARLDVTIREYERVVGRLKGQVDAARGALLTRSRAVAYLRETLFRETCLLRSKLQALQQQSQQQQQQQTQQLLGTPPPQPPASPLLSPPGTALARGGASSAAQAPLSLYTDLPTIHSLLDTVILGVEKDRLVVPPGPVDRPDSSTGATLRLKPEDELRRFKTRAEDEKAALRRQVRETNQRCSLIVQRKARELRMLRLASDPGRLREVVLDHVGAIRSELSAMKGSVTSLLSVMQTSLSSMSQEIEYAARRAGVEVGAFKEVRAGHRALQDALGCAEDLLPGVLRPEYAVGCHTSPLARQPDPFRFVVSQAHGETVVAQVGPELLLLHRLYVVLQRHSLAEHQQPDPNRPMAGRVLLSLAHRLLTHEGCGPDLVDAIRACVSREKELVAERARVNLSLKYHTYRRTVVMARATAALEKVGKDLTVPSSPPLRRAQAGIDHARATRAGIEEQRAANARALYQLWRHSNIDIWGPGRRAPVTRDPESTWMPAPPASRARRAAARGGNPSPAAVPDSTQSQPLGSLLPPATTTTTSDSNKSTAGRERSGSGVSRRPSGIVPGLEGSLPQPPS